MFIGVDVGTSVVKAVLYDREGEVRAVESRPTVTSSPRPGYAEQDLEKVLAAIGQTIRAASNEGSDRIELLAVTAHGDGLWLLDAAGRSVRPGIIWSDARAAAIVSEWIASGFSDEAFRRSGNVPFPGSAAPLLAHLARHEPEALASASTAGYCKDAINQRLTGARVTDASDASLPFLNVRTRRYDLDLIELFGVKEWAHLLAPVDPAPGVIRPLTAEGATITGLPPGTPVHVGPFDFPATVIGAGVNRPGDGLIALGTTLACGVVTDRIDTSGIPSGMTICMPQPERWMRLLPAMAGTMALDWLMPLIGSSHAELDALLERSRPGTGGVMMLPFLSSSGERAPFVDPAARGRIIGLSTASTRADIARAVCEGIAYAARQCLEAAGLAESGTVTITGGGSRVTMIRQILADVLGRPISIARQPETGTRGAVLAGAHAAGEELDIERWTRPEGQIDPDWSVTDLYERGYRRYLEEIERARLGWSGPSV